ncbi:MAG TPA: tetratricopeptide repeat protein [Candidatus Deferrimicrobiaceae bacterium]|jgi:tetratricopeptide (TPR) repeat protein
MNLVARRRARLCLVLLAGVAVYAISLGNGFIYDDNTQILANRWLRDFRSVPEIFSSHVWAFEGGWLTNYYRPLMHLAYLAIYQCFGPNPFWFHLASLLLHLLCCLSVYLVTEGLARSAAVESGWHDEPGRRRQIETLPFLAALFFAVHPVNTESVAFAACFPELLYTLFGLMSIHFFLRTGLTNREILSFSVPSAIALFLALLSKETAVVIPAFFLCHDLSFRRFERAGKTAIFLRYLPCGVVTAAYLGIRTAALGYLLKFREGGILSPGEMFAGFSRMILWCLHKLVWPFNHNFYPWLPKVSSLPPWQLAGMIVLLAGIVAASWLLCRRRPILLSALALLMLPILPILLGTRAVAQKAPVGEHYLYLSAAGFCIILAWCAVRLTECEMPRLGWRSVLVAALTGIYGVSAALRLPAFSDDLAIWKDTVKKSPDAPEPRAWLATSLFKKGRIDEGIAQARKSIALGGQDQANLYNLGFALQKRGNWDGAADSYRRLVAATPGDAVARYRLGEVLLASGKTDQAVSQLEEAVRLDDRISPAHLSLGIAYGRQGLAGKGRAEIEEALKLDPNLPGAQAALAVLGKARQGSRKQ